MPNLHKVERNNKIVCLFDNGKGLTYRQIAKQFGMKESAVSMVILRHRRQIKKEFSRDCTK